MSAYEQGKQDALQGKCSTALMFSGQRSHDEYILGFKAGIQERHAILAMPEDGDSDDSDAPCCVTCGDNSGRTCVECQEGK